MNISLAGTNVFPVRLAGRPLRHPPRAARGASESSATTEPSSSTSSAPRQINSLLDQQYQNLFMDTFAKTNRGAIDAHLLFSGAVGAVPPLTTPFSANPISQSFSMVARTIAARQALGVRRQTFFILFGGWDHHDEVLNAQASMLPVVSKGLGGVSRRAHRARREQRRPHVHGVGFCPYPDLERSRLRPRLGRQPHGDGRAGGRRRHLRQLPPAVRRQRSRHRARTADSDHVLRRVLRRARAPGSVSHRRTSRRCCPTSHASTHPDPGPPVGFLGGQQATIFTDGFESGDVSAWSSTVG